MNEIETYIQSVGGGAAFTPRALGAPVQDPLGAISASSYGLVSSVTLAGPAFDPGDINPGDCPFWHWLIADPFDFAAAAAYCIQLKFTSAIADNYLVYVGVYDGTIATLRGLYGGLNVNTGVTGMQLLTAGPVNYDPAASCSAAGGGLSFTTVSDPDNGRFQNGLVSSYSNTGPAHGYGGRVMNPTNWAGTAVYGFFAIGKSTAGSGGTIAGIELQDQVLPAFT